MTNSLPEPAGTADTEQDDGAPAQKKARIAKRRTHLTRPKSKPAQTAIRARKTALARRGSKTAKLLDLLRRPSGATLKELMKAAGWQSHSVRGFLSGTVSKKMSLRVESFKRDDQRAYRIANK